MMTLEEVANAVGQHLADEGVAFFDVDGNYPPKPGLPPVFIKRFPAHAPDEAVTLTVYSDTTALNPEDNVRILNIQVRSRAPFDADPLADQLRAALETQQAMWGDLYVMSCHRVSVGQLGIDNNDLDERSDNYMIATRRDTT